MEEVKQPGVAPAPRSPFIRPPRPLLTYPPPVRVLHNRPNCYMIPQGSTECYDSFNDEGLNLGVCSVHFNIDKGMFVSEPIRNDLYYLPGPQKINLLGDAKKPITEYSWKVICGDSTATEGLIKEILSETGIKENIKRNNRIMEHIKHNHNIVIVEQIKCNSGIMEYIKYNSSGIKSMAAKTDAMERVTINPLYSLGDIGSSSSLMDPNCCLKLDSGASMHVVGDYMMLQDFRPIYGAPQDRGVTLPDGSQLLIVGVGTIVMDGFSIPNVSLVKGLRTNLISVSQLDKRHGLCCAFFHNHCRVINSDGELVGGAILEENGLYVLRFLKVV